jgi:hypothetical protein
MTTVPVYADAEEPITAEACGVCCALVPQDLMTTHRERAHGDHGEAVEP